jgi:hypothetical protein
MKRESVSDGGNGAKGTHAHGVPGVESVAGLPARNESPEDAARLDTELLAQIFELLGSRITDIGGPVTRENVLAVIGQLLDSTSRLTASVNRLSEAVSLADRVLKLAAVTR